MSKRFDGKVAIVTGASSGMGYATALRLAQEGAKVVIAARSQDKLDDALNKLKEATGAQAIAVRTDVSDVSAIKDLVDTTVQKFGKVDAALLNAGAFSSAPIVETEEEAYHKLFEVNVKGTLFGLKHVIAAMKAAGTKGSIVVTGSAMSHAAKAKFEGAGLYSATKAATDALARYAAIEAADAGIRINTLSPGIVRTSIFDMSDEEYHDFAKDVALVARAGQSDEIAAYAAFLLSDEASFVTGSTALADGGWVLKA